MAPEFLDHYSVVDLGTPTGVPANLGGIAFLNANTLLLGGSANSGSGAIYSIGVTRDPVDNYINGFSGPATFYSSAPNIDGGLAFGPDGVLFYTGYPTNTIGQILPGSTSPDKVVSLNGDISASLGTLQFVPSGFDGAGQLKAASYSTGAWHTIELTPAGDGTFDFASISPAISIGGGPEGIAYVDGANPGFGVDSILVSEYSAGRVSIYDIDGNGDPLVASRRNFITNLIGAEGAAIDPLTGDFLFSTYGGSNRVIVATGFVTVPEPGSLSLAALGFAGFCSRRKRASKN